MVNTFGPLPTAQAQEFRLPAPGQMVALSPSFSPAVLKGIKLDPKNPFRFHFFVDTGDSLPKHNNKDMSFPNVPPGRDPAVTVTSVGNPLKIIYYISPQVWAWREKRVLQIKKLVDRMIVLFPFEQNIYKKYGMKFDYVGHPLIDEIIVDKDRTEVLKSIGLSAGKTTIGLMPGSRAKEVERHLRPMLGAAQKLYKQNQRRQFILLKASSVPLKLIEDELSSYKHLPLKIYDGLLYDGINAMDAAMVASGTATLEIALLKKPMVIIYKTSWLTYAIAKAVIKIPYIGLVNIVAGKKIVEELLQNDATAARLSDAIEAALHNLHIINELAAVKTALGKPGASLRAARVVLEELHVGSY